MATSPDAATQTMIDNLPAKTGKTLDAWLEVVARAGPKKHGEIVTLLKSEHGVTHGFANLIAHKYRERTETSASADPVDVQYSGAKAHLRPIYDELVSIVSSFGNDVEIAPKKSYVSLRRSKQFGLIQPSTKDRVDVGINLKGVQPGERLEASGSFNAMVSHRVRLGGIGDIDAELEDWLRQAYDAA